MELNIEAELTNTYVTFYVVNDKSEIVASFTQFDKAREYRTKRRDMTEEQCDRLALLESAVRVLGWEPERVVLETDTMAHSESWQLSGDVFIDISPQDVAAASPEQAVEFKQRFGDERICQGFALVHHAGSFSEPPSDDEMPLTEGFKESDFASCVSATLREVVDNLLTDVLYEHAQAKYYTETLP